MKLILIIINIIIAFSNDPVLIQARNDIKGVNENYNHTPNFSVNTRYRVYRDQETENLLESKNGKFVRYMGKSFTKIDNVETYVINDKIICINPDINLISVGDNKTLDFHPLQMNIDSLLTLCSEIRARKINENEIMYELSFGEDENAEYNRLDLSIDTKNKRFVQVVLYYATAMNLKSEFYGEESRPRLEITYNNFKVLKSDPLIFNEKNYVIKDGGKLKPAPKYYNYKVSDLRNETRIKHK
jgi:hypothetical protein